MNIPKFHFQLQSQPQQLPRVEIGPEIHALSVKGLHRSGRHLSEAFDGSTKGASEMGILRRNNGKLLWTSVGLSSLSESGF